MCLVTITRSSVDEKDLQKEKDTYRIDTFLKFYYYSMLGKGHDAKSNGTESFSTDDYCIHVLRPSSNQESEDV